MVLWAIENAQGGEIFVPKIPSYLITDLAEAIAPECERKIIGIRPGEKVHEEMITTSDSLNTIDLGPYYAILPTTSEKLSEAFTSKNGVQRVEPGFSYNSGTNPDFLTVEQLPSIISKHVDPTHGA